MNLLCRFKEGDADKEALAIVTRLLLGKSRISLTTGVDFVGRGDRRVLVILPSFVDENQLFVAIDNVCLTTQSTESAGTPTEVQSESNGNDNTKNVFTTGRPLERTNAEAVEEFITRYSAAEKGAILLHLLSSHPNAHIAAVNTNNRTISHWYRVPAMRLKVEPGYTPSAQLTDENALEYHGTYANLSKGGFSGTLVQIMDTVCGDVMCRVFVFAHFLFQLHRDAFLSALSTLKMVTLQPLSATDTIGLQVYAGLTKSQRLLVATYLRVKFNSSVLASDGSCRALVKDSADESEELCHVTTGDHPVYKYIPETNRTVLHKMVSYEVTDLYAAVAATLGQVRDSKEGLCIGVKIGKMGTVLVSICRAITEEEAQSL